MNWMYTKIKEDCRYLLWDRPCKFHKDTEIECPDCLHYAPKGVKILIIKLDAMGDVLRTTSILQGLKSKYPESFITWITMPASEELLLNNPYIDRVFVKDLDIMCILEHEKFDLVLNPDTSSRSALLASHAKAKRKLGFVFKNSKVMPSNKEAYYWYYMGMNDKLKKENKRTYQDVLLDMLRIPKEKQDIILSLTDSEISFGKDFAEKNNLNTGNPVIGLNTGAGGRWKLKSWPIEHTVELSKLIHKTGARFVLLGGPEERERNREILERAEVPILNSGTENSLREFASIVNICDLIVTSDSLALHMATALGKKAVVLFGPTSSAEIELYGRGVHVVTPLDCRCCYKRACDKKPNCMDTIEPRKVMECIEKLL